MTGRLPYHVFETSDYVDGDFNMLPAKLRQVGYVSHSFTHSTDLCVPLLLTDPNSPGGCGGRRKRIKWASGTWACCCPG